MTDTYKNLQLKNGQIPVSVAVDILKKLMPVGFIVELAVSTDPADLYGFGTWALHGVGRVVVCIDSSDTDFDTLNETRGAKTASAIVGDHSASNTGQASAGLTGMGSIASTVTLKAHTHSTPSLSHAITASTIVQPSIVAYRWERTA